MGSANAIFEKTKLLCFSVEKRRKIPPENMKTRFARVTSPHLRFVKKISVNTSHQQSTSNKSYEIANTSKTKAKKTNTVNKMFIQMSTISY